MALSGCEAVEVVETSTSEQAGISMQGISMQGISMQGISMQGISMQGFQLGGATLSGLGLTNVRVEQGEVVAEQGAATLRGADLIGAHFLAQGRNTTVNPAQTSLVEYRIADVIPEIPAYDPTNTGSTFLYTIEQWVSETSSWEPACQPDSDGRQVAIPLMGWFDERGDRIESTSLFTFGCTSGVIAKCYRWGYRPWVTGRGDLTAMHWSCTRLARADYCGDGVPHTLNGTLVNIWDTLTPSPIQPYTPPPLNLLNPYVFEAGWGTGGAVCLSHARWITSLGSLLFLACPDRLLLPGLGPKICSSVQGVLNLDPGAKLFNQSRLLNIAL